MSAKFSRRRFLKLAASGAVGMVAAACVSTEMPEAPEPAAPEPTAPEPAAQALEEASPAPPASTPTPICEPVARSATDSQCSGIGSYGITNLCLRCGACVAVCPVEAIVPGNPTDEWPLYYIDLETCIGCGACVPECPWEAIFPGEEIPAAYTAKGTLNVLGQDLPQRLNMPAGTPCFDEVYDGFDIHNEPIHLEHTRILEAGEVVDLTLVIEESCRFFKEGPGHS